jgi:hypothetical protein
VRVLVHLAVGDADDDKRVQVTERVESSPLDGVARVTLSPLVAAAAVAAVAAVIVVLGRNSPIVKHYSSIKNPCFVTCINYALCSYG